MLRCSCRATDPVKIVRLRVTNDGHAAAAARVVRLRELVLGDRPRRRAGPSRGSTAMPASSSPRNPQAGDFADRVAYAAVADPGYTAMPRSGTRGHRRPRRVPRPCAARSARPRPCSAADRSMAATGAGLDPCAAFRVPLDGRPRASAVRVRLPPRRRRTRRRRARVAARYRAAGAVDAALEEVRALLARDAARPSGRRRRAACST